MLSDLINQAETIWEEKGGYEYFKNIQPINQAINLIIPKAKQYLEDGKSNAQSFSWRCYEMDGVINDLNEKSYILTELDKEVYALAKERDKLNSNDYTSESWDLYTKAVDKALTTANGSGEESKLPDEIQAIKDARAKLVKVDKHLVELKKIATEVDGIIQSQQNPETALNYTKDSWSALTNAYTAAQTELKKDNTTIDVELFNTLKNNLLKAKNGLVINDTEIPGVEHGVLKDWKGYQKSSNVRGGKLYVSNEIVNSNGTSKIIVKWINDGTDPFTGGLFHNLDDDYANSALDVFGEWSLRPITKDDLWHGHMYLDVFYTINGTTEYDKHEIMTEEQALNGFETDFVVPSGSAIELKMGQSGGQVRTFSLGTYYTNTPDTTAPVINANDVTLIVGDKFDPLKDVTATDNVDGDLTKSIVVSGDKVDTTKAGTYNVTYTVTDVAGNETKKTIIVTVNPKMAIINTVPSINAKDKTLTVGDAFDPLKGVTASDAEDGDLTSKISCKSNVDRNKVGVYKVTYTVMDSQGATTSKTIQVTVEKKAVTPETKPNTENKPNDKKDPEKGNGTNTGVASATGLFAGLAGISATAAAILETLKRRKK